MRRLFLSLFLAGALLSGVVCAADGVAQGAGKAAQGKHEKLAFGYLMKWERLLPYKTKDLEDERPAHPAIWEDLKVKQEMLKTLGEDRYKQVTERSGAYGVVLHHDDYLNFPAYYNPPEQWQPEIQIYISLKDGSVKACWEDKTDEWIISGSTARRLPDGYCDDRDYKKIYREQNEADLSGK
ncbi:MAG: hypothetical protein PHY92_01645 [Alphaproteobacteria bacterium]|nr:hypothetical protein [Alphaproteobacteria bacterium]